MHRRAISVFILSTAFVMGLCIYVLRYTASGSTWVQYPVNKHIYSNGELIEAGAVYDRCGEILAQTVDGTRVFNDDWATRVALMHAVGDLSGNISTGVQVIYGEKLIGWDPVNGVYRYENDSKSDIGITLTLDSELCVTAYEALGQRKGTVGVYNYKTGEILCMISSPTFDPQNPPDVEADPIAYEGVYLNRLLSARYTPGSIFKLLTAAAAIDEISDIDEKLYHCEGKIDIDGVLVTCPSSHGDVTFQQALADSCNVAFAEITIELGAETLQKYADSMGVNTSLAVGEISTLAGNVEVSDAKGADLAWAGIGQYTDTVNPLNFMTYVGAIANDGKQVQPRLIIDENIFSKLFSSAGNEQIMSGSTAGKLKEMMRNNVTSNYGEHNFAGLELCAKSGTGEVGKEKAPHAWFVGFLDREDCPLAFVVLIENGGSGLGAAGPVAARVMQRAVDIMTVG